MLIFKFGQILGVNVKGWVRCEMKGLQEFRINIECNSWGRVLVQGALLACTLTNVLT